MILYSCGPGTFTNPGNDDKPGKGYTGEDDFVGDESKGIIVWIADGTNADQKINDLRDAGIVTGTKSCPCSNQLYLVNISQQVDPNRVPAVVEDEVDYEAGDQASKNIPISARTFGKIETENIRAPKYPKSVIDNAETVIAIIDTGVEVDGQIVTVDHMWHNMSEISQQGSSANLNTCFESDYYGFDFVNDQSTTAARTLDIHGTMVAQVLLNNSTTSIRLMDLQVFDADGKGNLFDALCAIEYARIYEADILNLSWGYYSSNQAMTAGDSILQKAIEQLAGESLVVSSAGNDSIDNDSIAHYPSQFQRQPTPTAYTNLLSVASIADNQSTKLADYSNWGQTTVGLAAVGQHSFVIRGQSMVHIGTSFAAPTTTAVAARLWLEPDSSPERIAECIITNTLNIQERLISQGKLNPTVTCTWPRE